MKQSKLFDKKLQLQQKQLDDYYFQKMKNNPLLKNYDQLTTYFKKWMDGSELVAVIPTLAPQDPKSRSYYASCNQLSAVFLYQNQPYHLGDENLYGKARFFLFDSECEHLFSFQKKQNSQSFEAIPKENFEKQMNIINQNPFVLFFKGCDDGHVGKRFPTEKDAMEYLQIMDYFEEIFEDKDLQYHN
jgi:hypothetical protein